MLVLADAAVVAGADFLLQVIVALLEPVVRRKLVLLVLVRLREDACELGADLLESFVARYMVEFEALPDLAVAGGAEVQWTPVGLLQVVDTHHEALVQCAVTETEHMAELVRGKLDDAHQCLTLELFLGVVLFFGPLGQETMDAVDTAIAVSVAEAEVAQVFGEEVDIGETDDSKGVWVSSLDWSNKFLKDVNSIVLGVVEIVPLGVNSETLDLVVGLGVKDDDLAWHVECLHPFLKLGQVLRSDC